MNWIHNSGSNNCIEFCKFKFELEPEALNQYDLNLGVNFIDNSMCFRGKVNVIWLMNVVMVFSGCLFIHEAAQVNYDKRKIVKHVTWYSRMQWHLCIVAHTLWCKVCVIAGDCRCNIDVGCGLLFIHEALMLTTKIDTRSREQDLHWYVWWYLGG